jgi:hypothetical protein
MELGKQGSQNKERLLIIGAAVVTLAVVVADAWW